MASVDLEVNLTDQEREIRDTVRKFAQEVMRPAGTALDRLSDPADVIAPDSVLWQVMSKYADLQLNMLDLGNPDFTPLEQGRLRCLVFEELGWGDAGLAISLGVAGFHRMFAQMSGNPALIERFAGPDSKEIGCWAVTEPDHGSDTLAFTEPHFGDPKIRPNCVAHREGDEYVIDGQKAAWVSNGNIATVAALFCTVDPSLGFKGGGFCLVPIDLPGVSRGKPLV